MKAIISFWKKDIINKLIVFVSVALLVGAFIIAYLLMNMKSDSMFYAVFSSTVDKNGIPTLAVGSSTAITQMSSTIPTPNQAPATQIIQPTIEQEVPTTVIPAPTLEIVLPTASPAPPAATPVSTQSSSEVGACMPANPAQTGVVLDVIDGNTVKVLIDGIAYTVRYIGIDVPKYRPAAEYFGQESDFKNAEYVYAKKVTLISDIQDKDDNGRLLRYVKVGDIFVNYELVRQGFAKASSASSACAQVFKVAEQVASQSRMGLWNPTPTPPSP